MKRIIPGGAALLSALCLLTGVTSQDRLLAQTGTSQAVHRPAFSLVTGTVTYRQRIALPANAILKLRLEDVSLQDVASKLVAEVTLPTNGKQVPFGFAIPYRQTDIVRNHRYQVRAMILVNDNVMFTTTTAYPVLTNGASNTVSILVQSIGGSHAPSSHALEETYWKLTYLAGQTPLVPAERREPQITLHKEGKKMSGTAGCNGLFGTYALAGNSLRFRGIGGTMMACPEPLMKQERVFTDALKATTSYRITGGQLELLAGARVVARFQAGQPR
jgi:putative lipoprotein